MFVASHQLFPLEHPLWLFLTSPGSHSSSFHMFAHSVPHPLPSGLTCTSLGHSPHTQAVTSAHIACSLTCHPMCAVSHHTWREGSEQGELPCLPHSTVRCSCQHQERGDADSVPLMDGLLCVHPRLDGLQEPPFRNVCFSANQHWAENAFPCWKPEASIHVGHLESVPMARNY